MALASSETQNLNGPIQLRRARWRDWRPALKIEQAAFGHQALDPFSLALLTLRRWPGFIVAEYGGEAIGYIILRLAGWPKENRRGGIISLAVHPGHLRRGIGRRLMLAAEDFIRQSGGVALDLEVDITNEAALALYDALGYKTLKPLPDYYGSGKDGKRMTLALTPPQAGENTT
jgi:ribosomal protein S18 acetylase RimI-like enzyme